VRLHDKLGKHPTIDRDFYKACIEAIMKVELLKRLHERLGGEVKSDLIADLVEITAVAPSVAADQEPNIRKLYKDALQYLKDEKEVSEMRKPEVAEPTPTSAPTETITPSPTQPTSISDYAYVIDVTSLAKFESV